MIRTVIRRNRGRKVTKQDFDEYIRLRRRQNQNRLSNWVVRSENLADAAQLVILNKVLGQFKGVVRTRLEADTISVFSENEETLVEFIRALKSPVEEVTRPSSPEAEEKLRNNTIFSKTMRHNYRVEVTYGKYTPEIKKQILNYVRNYDGEITLSPSIAKNLETDRPISGYFHCEDTDVLLFLKMIAPSFVKKIFTLAPITQ